MTDNTPTFHHLNNSQSQRIFWLLEELSIPYNLQSHTRNPATDPKAPFLAPPSLKAISNYGKAPLLVTGPKDGNRSIPECLAIATYLIRTFDSADTFGLREGDWIRDEMLLSVIMTELGQLTYAMLMLDFNFIANGAGPMGKLLDGPALRKVLGVLEKELKEGPEGGFFMGKNPGRADIMLEFPMTLIKQRGWVDIEKEFPALGEWLTRCYERPAWKRSIEKGNGYDLTTFPQKAHLQAQL
ncbi:Bcgst20 [Botrytis cinerea B05.10]|uniref:Bcgst20 n=2 Tax=Botryotinia fuckeliana TaxID=40559 RepID=A0A384JZU0_BOTFB|nr:Bcgst20 [Botrytis cinerea B05.10]ATZ56031.1 Bcgst20 [Botrytis cinerea B05.10]EMR86919.1 putative glutathione s-transferase protein [Botrytis cinerea BcDW1]